MMEIINILIALVIYDIIKGIINWKSYSQNDIKKKTRKSFEQRLKEKMDWHENKKH